MAKNISGSPFHIESARYKYAIEKSEVPIAPSEFNKTITYCSKCLFWIQESPGHYSCYSEKVKDIGSKHCIGFKDDKTVYNAPAIRHELLMKRIKQNSRNRINNLASQINKYRLGTDPFVDQLFHKKWAICGSNPDYDKNALNKLIAALKGENNSSKPLIKADYVIRLNTGKMGAIKLLKKEIDRVLQITPSYKVPKIVTYKDFCMYFDKLEEITK